MPTLDALSFLQNPPADEPVPSVVVLFGDDAFLKETVRGELLRLAGAADDASSDRLDGEAVAWRDVHDALRTISLFDHAGTRRIVVVEAADAFVKRHRDELLDYAKSPAAPSMLVLDVATWQSNTLLYRAVEKHGWQIACQPPTKSRGKSRAIDETRICQWLVHWAKTRHQLKLPRTTAATLLELVGPHFGLLHQELSKLALYVEPGVEVPAELVQQVVGTWRQRTTWEMIDAIASGDAPTALSLLNELLRSGQEPVGILAQLAWSLRRFAAATRAFEYAERSGRKIPLREALIQAGFPAWNANALRQAEQQLLQIGRVRARRLLRSLLQLDLALKGSHSSLPRARFALEQFILSCSKQLAPRKPRRQQSAASR